MRDLFDKPKPIIGMLHLGALPATPRCSVPLPDVIERAVSEAGLLLRCGCQGLILENMGDTPYLNSAVGPEIVAAMTAAAAAVRQATTAPLGIQVLAAANESALAVALAARADFIRVENFCYAHVADEGLMPTAAAGPLLRYRRQIGAEAIRIVADIKKKHAGHAITADVSLRETAAAAEFMGADGVIVSGSATAMPTRPEDVRLARAATRLPVWVGSGVTRENLASLWPIADGFIVGSTFKHEGVWSAPLDESRIRGFFEEVQRLRHAG